MNNKGLLLFSLPFAAIGTFAAYFIFSTITEWQSAKSWEETQGQLQSIELKSSRGSKGGTTYRAIGQFSYHYKGQNYQSESISFWSSSDNMGGFHRKLYNRLKGKKTITCYVNPDDPDSAVIDRSLRPGMIGFMMIFALAFGGAGYGLFFFSLKQSSTPKASPTDSKDLTMKVSGLSYVLLFITFSVLTSMASIAIFSEIIKQGQAGLHFSYLALLLPASALTLSALSIYTSLRYLNFRSSTLTIEGGEGILGGEVKGFILNHCEAVKGFDITLNCNQQVTHGNKTSWVNKYKKTWNIKDQEITSTGQYKTNFALPLPYSLPESDNNKITWTLHFTADVPGPDYSAKFSIPVIATTESNPDQTQLSLEEDKEFSADDACLSREKITVHQTNDRLHIYLPMFRRVSGIIGFALFTLFWTGILSFMIYKKIWFMAAIWGFFDLIMIYALLNMMFVSAKLIIAPEGIVFKKGFFGGGKEICVKKEDIKEVSIPYNNRPSMNYLRIKYQGKTIKFDERFKDRETVLALKVMIDEMLGLEADQD
jgi:hypothetical protein